MWVYEEVFLIFQNISFTYFTFLKNLLPAFRQCLNIKESDDAKKVVIRNLQSLIQSVMIFLWNIQTCAWLLVRSWGNLFTFHLLVRLTNDCLKSYITTNEIYYKDKDWEIKWKMSSKRMSLSEFKWCTSTFYANGSVKRWRCELFTTLSHSRLQQLIFWFMRFVRVKVELHVTNFFTLSHSFVRSFVHLVFLLSTFYSGNYDSWPEWKIFLPTTIPP